MAATDPVVVIGGGPAGSTAATALARKGHRVVLLERERFPREHIGESLLPSSMPFLEWLGILPRIEEAGFLRKWGTTMVWGKAPEPWSWYFRETNQRYEHTYQVHRAEFDGLLLDNARAHGVDVREGHRVTQVLFEDGRRARGVRFRTGEGESGETGASWVIDASGQGAVIGGALGLRRWDDFFRNMAVYAYFEGAARLPPPDENNLFIESYKDGWLWCIPLHTGLMSVGAVVDARVGSAGSRRGLAVFLEDQIGRAPRVSAMLADSRMVAGPVAVRDWSYISDEVVGDGWTIAGDAACFIDPLFSSGIHLAMMSGAMAAAYVTSTLKDEGMRGPGALFYRDQYRQEYGQFRELAKLFYGSNRSVESYFWEARRIIGDEVGSGLAPREAFVRAVAGRPPRGYERVVIESGEAPPGFMADVRRLQGERLARKEAFETAIKSTEGRQRKLEWRTVLAQDVRLQKQPEVRDGEFAWGYAISRDGGRLGEPLDSLSVSVLAFSDGKTPASEIATRLRRSGVDLSEPALLEVMGRLVVEGVLA